MPSWLGTRCIPVISDVHGNMSGLKAVLADLDALGCHAPPIFLGDLFWTGERNRQPREVLETLMSMQAVAYLRGNTEELLMSRNFRDWEPRNETDRQEKAIMLAFRNSLSKSEASFIEAFVDRHEFCLSGQSVIAAHASPASCYKGLNADLPQQDWRDRFGDGSAYLLTGHLHRHFIHTLGDLTHICVGAVGRADHEDDGIAEYALLTESAGGGLCVFFQRVKFQ
jgi:predicted phosphodiesterase